MTAKKRIAFLHVITVNVGPMGRPGRLRWWPFHHRTRDSIDAHLTIVFAALAVSHWTEHQTVWRIKKFVRTARRYRTVRIQAGRHTLTAAEPPPDNLAEALAKIHGSGGAH